ncbi:GNAT family N-acetyltransferase [Clostridium felsineum]|uniref:GNAT family N-acetyltransferase n=1 Tax=Clostridium felsineum TaxID=36839 RepID=UPI00098C4C70|nr:GNAT family N-acetyltransferase [Clostridium felsineum]URZ14968.1 hypothetical protein CLFE_009810 [Clostridium felsineum DSM 794]
MIIRKIERKDINQLENLINSCMREFKGDKVGCTDVNFDFSIFYSEEKNKKSNYWVVEEDENLVAGCGIKPLSNNGDICELYSMYLLKEVRQSRIDKILLEIALDFAGRYYRKCYVKTFSNMIAVNEFYKKNGFISLKKPIFEKSNNENDAWYIKEL